MVERKRVQIFFEDPSLTRQEFKDECDLSLVLKRFQKTPEGASILQNARGFAPGAVFDDVSGVPDYRAAFEAVNAAKASFNALAPNVRARFNNDPASFFNFVSNPANQEEARSLGLCKPAPQDAAKAPSIATQVAGSEALK